MHPALSVHGALARGAFAVVVLVSLAVLFAPAADGLTAEEVVRGRGQLKGGLVLGLEDTGSRMSRLGKSELSFGEYLPVREVLDRLDAVDEQQVRDLAGDLLARESCLAVVGPYRASDLDRL